MYNYYKFTNFLEDCDSINYFESLSTQILINYLDSSFIFIETLLNYFSSVFKNLFNGKDYDEFYYSCKSLIEELNDIKIILNILKDRDND